MTNDSDLAKEAEQLIAHGWEMGFDARLNPEFYMPAAIHGYPDAVVRVFSLVKDDGSLFWRAHMELRSDQRVLNYLLSVPDSRYVSVVARTALNSLARGDWSYSWRPKGVP